MLDAELRICSALRLDFAIPSALDFLYCGLQRLEWPSMFAVHRGAHKHVAMLAQLFCELGLLSHECANQPGSLVAAGALCLAIACLRCGLWRDGAPGPSSSPEQYWTASMAQATGYSRLDLTDVLRALQGLHETAGAELASSPLPGVGARGGRFAVLRHKFSHPRFLEVLRVPPFMPHAGGTPFGSTRSPFASPLGELHS